MPTSDEWVVLEELVTVLKRIQEAIELLSGIKYATISTMYPVLHKLLHFTLKSTEEDSSEYQDCI